jgi:hypothetical protein
MNSMLRHALQSTALTLLLAISPAVSAQDLTSLVRTFESSLSKSPAAQQEAALNLLKHYKDYKSLVANQQVSKETARALDNHLVGMTQDVWGEVAKRNPGLSYVVPVGTLGDRTDPKYIPGKSDKDFIPRGTGATDAAQDFTSAFERKFGIKPGSVDVNALDPTKIETWPDRVIATADFEKYNTRGGVNWLEREMHAKKPNLWQFHPESGRFSEASYSSLVKNPPPPLTKADALGFHSDNMKFRNVLGERYGSNAADLALKQSKYDLRNVEAFGLAGGKLTKEEAELIAAAQMFRNGNNDAAVDWIKKITKTVDKDAALSAYLKNMDQLSERMSRQIVTNHIELLSRQGGRELLDEMAAALHNMPAKYRSEMEKQITAKLGASKWKEISAMSDAFTQRLVGYELLDAASRSKYGKPLNQLSSAERKLLEEGLESTESFASKAAKAAGISIAAGFAIYAIYEAWEANEKAGGSGAAAGAGRAAIELLQLGYPPLVVAELMGRLGAGVVNLGISAYKDSALEALYEQYRSDGNRDLDLLLNTYGVDRYSAGALRQMAIEMRAENHLITDEEIDQRIRDYFTRRLVTEQQANQFSAFIARAESWIHKNEIPLEPGGDWMQARSDNEAMLKNDPERYYRMLGALMQHYENVKQRLLKKNGRFTEAEIWHELFLIYRGMPIDPAEFAGTWSDGILVFVDLPILEMMKQDSSAPKTLKTPTESDDPFAGCELDPAAFEAIEKALKSLKGRNLKMTLIMNCNRDPSTGTGSINIQMPPELAKNAEKGDPLQITWKFAAPDQLTCEGLGSNNKLKMHLKADIAAETQRLTLTGTWTGLAAKDPKQRILMSGTWRAMKNRGTTSTPAKGASASKGASTAKGASATPSTGIKKTPATQGKSTPSGSKTVPGQKKSTGARK